jgi:hypothetical protein
MLSRLVLLAAQVVGGWFAAQALVDALPRLGALGIFHLCGTRLAGGLIGLARAHIPRDTRSPSSATLTGAVVLALAGALRLSLRPALRLEARRARRGRADDLAVSGNALKR